MRRSLATSVVAVVLALPLAASAQPPAETPAAALAEIAEAHWQHQLERSPALRVRLGLPVAALPDLSHAAAQRDAELARELRERLLAIEPTSLAHEDWLTWAVLDWELARAVEAAEHFWHFFQVTPYRWSGSGIDQTLSALPLASASDLDGYLSLVRQLPRVVGQLREHLDGQEERGVLVPRPALEAIVGLYRAQAALGEESPFWVADERLEALPPAERQRFQAGLRDAIAAEVAPALGALAERLDGAYRERAPLEVGLGQYAGGGEAYRWAVILETTLEVMPEEIHRRGLEAVRALQAEMAALRRELGLPAAAREAHAALRQDRRFLAASPEEVAERLMAPIRRLEPRVGEFFARLPAAPYGVERLDPRLEGSMTFGYYQWPTPEEPTGRYLFNGSRLGERPLVTAAALIAHELVPGHHFQIALQAESEALPAFRRQYYPTAFVEGWAEYASELVSEMGLYAEPWDRYGRLAMDLFLSTRLVVDTGMHAMGWSQERAAEFMRENLLESDTQIATETLRYAVDLPAQALAYKMGSSTFWSERRAAEAALGACFDLRRFHDAVLGPGALPLTVLQEHLAWWVAQEGARCAGSAAPGWSSTQTESAAPS